MVNQDKMISDRHNSYPDHIKANAEVAFILTLEILDQLKYKTPAMMACETARMHGVQQSDFVNSSTLSKVTVSRLFRDKDDRGHTMSISNDVLQEIIAITLPSVEELFYILLTMHPGALLYMYAVMSSDTPLCTTEIRAMYYDSGLMTPIE